MYRLLFFLLFLLSSCSQRGQSQESLGGSGGETVEELLADGEESFWMAGLFQDTWDSLQARGQTDAWLAYRSPTNNWRISLGDASNNRVLALAKDKNRDLALLLIEGRGSLYIQGQELDRPGGATTSFRQYWLLAFDSRGQCLSWQRLAASGFLELQSLFISDSSAIYLGGAVQGELYLNEQAIAQSSDSLYQVLALGIDSLGQVQSLGLASGNKPAEIKGFALDSSGYLQVFGSFQGNWAWGSFRGQSNDVYYSIFRARYHLQRAAWEELDIVGGIYDKRIIRVLQSGDSLFVLAQFMGQLRFSESLEASTAFRYWNYALWAWPLEDFGEPFWLQRSYQWFGNSFPKDLALSARGELALCGSFEPQWQYREAGPLIESQGSLDAFAAFYDRSGRLLGAWSGGGQGFDEGQAISWQGGTCLLGGWYQNNWLAGAQLQQARGYSDGFLLNLDPLALHSEPQSTEEPKPSFAPVVENQILKLRGDIPEAIRWQLFDSSGRSLALGAEELHYPSHALPCGIYIVFVEWRGAKKAWQLSICP